MGSFSSKTPGPTAQETALKQVSLQQAKDFNTRIKPLEDELIRRSTSTAGDKTQARGLASTDTAMASAGRDEALVEGLGAQGTKGKFARAGLSMALGTMAGRGQGDAEAAVETKDQGAKLNIALNARGQQARDFEAAQHAVKRGTNDQLQALDRKMERFNFVMKTAAQGIGAGYERHQQLKEIDAYNASDAGKLNPYTAASSKGFGRGVDIVTAGFMPNKYDSFFNQKDKFYNTKY